MFKIIKCNYLVATRDLSGQSLLEKSGWQVFWPLSNTLHHSCCTYLFWDLCQSRQEARPCHQPSPQNRRLWWLLVFWCWQWCKGSPLTRSQHFCYCVAAQGGSTFRLQRWSSEESLGPRLASSQTSMKTTAWPHSPYLPAFGLLHARKRQKLN